MDDSYSVLYKQDNPMTIAELIDVLNSVKETFGADTRIYTQDDEYGFSHVFSINKVILTKQGRLVLD